MDLQNIIPAYLLKSPELLATYCHLLRNVKPYSMKRLLSGEVVSLNPYEDCGSIDEATLHLVADPHRVQQSLMKLEELDLINLKWKDDRFYIKIKRLVLPLPDDVKRSVDPVLHDDCWFDDFHLSYLEYVETNMARKTALNAHRVLKLFGHFVGRRKLADLKAEDLEAYKRSRKGSVMDTTINMDVRTLKAALEVAVVWGRLASNPFRAVKCIRLTNKKMRPFTKDEFTGLCVTIQEPWLVDIVRFAVLTGLRRGEIMNLRWDDLDVVGGNMTVQSSEEYRVKHGKTRTLPLHPEALETIKRQQRCCEWVFSNNGERWKDEFVSKKVKGYIRQLGLDEELHFHSLRGTSASRAIREGVPMAAVQSLLGHASIKTTEGYATLDRESLRVEVAKISIPP